MFDKLFFVLLVLNATGLFQFVAPQIGVDIRTVSISLLVLQVGYLLVRKRDVRRLLREPGMQDWLILLVFWPLATVLYAPTLEVREVGLQVYYASLFTGAVVYARANGLSALHRVMGMSLLVTVFGLVLSMVAPSCFEAVARLANARTQYGERAFGFFMQPNQAGMGLILLFLGWYSLWRDKDSLWDVPALILFLVAVLFTGSRTCAVIAAAVCGMTVFDAWRRGRREDRKGFRLVYVKACLLAVCLAFGLAGLNQYATATEGGLYHRLRLLTSLQLTENGILDDNSVRQRLAAQKVYWSLIETKPVLGHGLGAEAYYSENGPIWLSAHSTLLSTWLEFGIAWPLVFYLLLYRLYRSRDRMAAERRFGTNAVFMFVLILSLHFAFNHGMVESRVFYVVLAYFFAATETSLPAYLESESTTRRPTQAAV